MLVDSAHVPCAEIIDGQRFAWVTRTPLLRSMTGHAASVIAEVLAHLGLSFRIDQSEPLALGMRTTLIPDLAVCVDDRPTLVIEYRSESTERYILGPKRLVYGRGRIPEFWFVDPQAETVLAMTNRDGGDYEWPAKRYGPGEKIESRSILGLTIAYEDLAGGELS